MSKTINKKTHLKLILALFVPVVLVGLVLDRLSKDLTILYLKDKDPIDLIPGVIRLTYCENRGAAFSLLEGQRWFFIVLTVIVLAFVAVALWRCWIKTAFGYFSTALCVSGAIGNFIDRLTQGFVVDMFEPTFIKFAIFNVADIYLTIGAILLGIYLLFVHDKIVAKKKEASATEASPEA